MRIIQYCAFLFPDLLKRQLFSEFIKTWQITCFGLLPWSHLPSYWWETKFYSLKNKWSADISLSLSRSNLTEFFKKDKIFIQLENQGIFNHYPHQSANMTNFTTNFQSSGKQDQLVKLYLMRCPDFSPIHRSVKVHDRSS